MKKIKINCAIIILVASNAFATSMEILLDSRDGQKYKTVTIGSQIWMAENLNYKVPNSFCYGNRKDNCQKYGRLYKWKSAIDVCPAGWHLPSKNEYESLADAVGGLSIAGKKLKSAKGWLSYEGKDGNGSDSYGFSVKSAGFWGDYGTHYYGEGDFANYWSSTENGEYNAYRFVFDAKKDDVSLSSADNTLGHSVRCVKDDSNLSKE